MTNEQIKQHLERVVKTAKDIATKTCSQQWENYKKSRVENGERPIPKEMDESIRDVFTFAAYAVWWMREAILQEIRKKENN